MAAATFLPEPSLFLLGFIFTFFAHDSFLFGCFSHRLHQLIKRCFVLGVLSCLLER